MYCIMYLVVDFCSFGLCSILFYLSKCSLILFDLIISGTCICNFVDVGYVFVFDLSYQ